MAKKKTDDKKDSKKQLLSLNKYLEKLTDPKKIFLFGIVRGLGAAVGATIVAGLLFWILSRAFTTVEDVPVLKDLVENFRQAVDGN